MSVWTDVRKEGYMIKKCMLAILALCFIILSIAIVTYYKQGEIDDKIEDLIIDP